MPLSPRVAPIVELLLPTEMQLALLSAICAMIVPIWSVLWPAAAKVAGDPVR